MTCKLGQICLSASARVLLVLVLVCAGISVNAWQLETRQININSTFGGGGGLTNITFSQTYAVPPVVVATASNQGGDSSDIFIVNVSTTGFQMMPVEPNSNDGPHVGMNLDYIAVEPGSHTFPDGTRIEAGRINTTSVQHGIGVAGPTAWDTVNFTSTFSSPPVVVANVLTHNNESANPPATSSIPFLSIAVNNVTNTSVDLAIERSESGSGAVTVDETLGYIAIEDGVTGTFLDNASNVQQYEAFISPNPIRGWTDGCFNQPFSNTYAIRPRVVATKITRNESDGGWLRGCARNTAIIGLVVDEDRDTNGERSHIAERAGILVFGRDFDASLQPDLVVLKTQQVIADPFSATNPKAIPGSTINYQVLLTNQGDGAADLNTTVLTDPIPVPASLVVNDIAGAGTGPVLFTDGATSSALTYTFVSLASTTDDLSFSNDNAATFNYTPTADVNGVDAAVTHIRVNPKGTFNGQTGTGATTAQLRFRVQVD